MADFTWVDFILFGVIFFNLIAGIARGPIKEIISIMILIVALVIAIKYTAPLTNFLNNSAGFMDVIDVFARFLNWNATQPLTLLSWGVALLLLFAGSYCIGETVNYYAAVSIVNFPIAVLGRIIGGALGFARGYIFALITILVLGLTPVVETSAWSQSVLMQRLAQPAQSLGNKIAPGGFPMWSRA